MNFIRSHARFTAVAVLFMSALLLSACNDPQRALAPPNADVTGIQTVVVFPFVNASGERGVENDIVTGLLRQLQAVGWYNVIGPERVEPLLRERRVDSDEMRPDSLAWNETAREIAIELDADGFITGIALAYDEQLTVSAAYHIPGPGGTAPDSSPSDSSSTGGHAESASPDNQAPTDERSEGTSPNVFSVPDEWLVDQTTEVIVTVAGKLVNVHTGVAVYERTVNGSGLITDPRRLNWSIPESPPATLIPAPHRRDIASARSAAVEDALNAFTRDILPQRVDDAAESGRNDDGR